MLEEHTKRKKLEKNLPNETNSNKTFHLGNLKTSTFEKVKSHPISKSSTNTSNKKKSGQTIQI